MDGILFLLVMYGLGSMAFEQWQENKFFKKFPIEDYEDFLHN